MSILASLHSCHDIPTRGLVPFLALSFGIAWGALTLLLMAPLWLGPFAQASAANPLFILAVYAPAIAAMLLVLAYGGTDALRRYLARLLLWHGPAGWWAFLLIGIPLVYALGAALKGTFGWGDAVQGGAGALLLGIGFMLVLGPVEELGWRGFALPLLQRLMAPFWAGLALGAVWGIWHLPAFLLSGTPQADWPLLPFLVGTLALSVLITALFGAFRGSILLPMLFHFQVNNPLFPDAQPYDSALFAVAAAVAVWLARDRMFTRAGAVTDVSPPSHAISAPLAT